MDAVSCVDDSLRAVRCVLDKPLHIRSCHGAAAHSLGYQQMQRAAHLRQQIIRIMRTQHGAGDGGIQDSRIHALQFDV